MISWMYWTVPSVIGFSLLFGMLLFLTFLDIKKPSYPTKGFLPMPTTRGDRVFISIAGFFMLIFIWLYAAPDLTHWIAVIAAIINAVIILRWG